MKKQNNQWHVNSLKKFFIMKRSKKTIKSQNLKFVSKISKVRNNPYFNIHDAKNPQKSSHKIIKNSNGNKIPHGVSKLSANSTSDLNTIKSSYNDRQQQNCLYLNNSSIIECKHIGTLVKSLEKYLKHLTDSSIENKLLFSLPQSISRVGFFLKNNTYNNLGSKVNSLVTNDLNLIKKQTTELSVRHSMTNKHKSSQNPTISNNFHDLKSTSCVRTRVGWLGAVADGHCSVGVMLTTCLLVLCLLRGGVRASKDISPGKKASPVIYLLILIFVLWKRMHNTLLQIQSGL